MTRTDTNTYTNTYNFADREALDGFLSSFDYRPFAVKFGPATFVAHFAGDFGERRVSFARVYGNEADGFEVEETEMPARRH